MKKHILSTLILGILLQNCSSSTEQTENNSQTETTTPTEATNVPAEVDYESAWQNFISVVESGDLDKFKAYCGTDVSDPESILMVIKEDWVVKTMKETPFKDFGVSDYNGITVKEFSAYFSATDEEGNEMESAVFLYFEKTDTDIKLVNVLMAG